MHNTRLNRSGLVPRAKQGGRAQPLTAKPAPLASTSRLAVLLVVTAAAVTLALTVPAFGQTYQTVALTGQSAPGTAAGVNYEVFLGPPAVDIGQVVYFARLTGAGVTGANEAAIYAGPAAGPQLVARTGNAAPGTAAGVNYSGLDGSPSLNGTGQVAYLASLTGTGITTANNAAIYAGPVAGPQLVAREGSAAPGTAAGVNYSVLNDTPALNDAGQVAYRAGLTGTGVTTANDAAIYAGPAAGPQLVAREGSAAPGTEAGVNYLSFFTNSTTLNDAGQVAYRAVLTGAGITTANDSAIYAGPAADPRLVARTGDAAPGTPGRWRGRGSITRPSSPTRPPSTTPGRWRTSPA